MAAMLLTRRCVSPELLLNISCLWQVISLWWEKNREVPVQVSAQPVPLNRNHNNDGFHKSTRQFCFLYVLFSFWSFMFPSRSLLFKTVWTVNFILSVWFPIMPWLSSKNQKQHVSCWSVRHRSFMNENWKLFRIREESSGLTLMYSHDVKSRQQLLSVCDAQSVMNTTAAFLCPSVSEEESTFICYSNYRVLHCEPKENKKKKNNLLWINSFIVIEDTFVPSTVRTEADQLNNTWQQNMCTWEYKTDLWPLSSVHSGFMTWQSRRSSVRHIALIWQMWRRRQMRNSCPPLSTVSPAIITAAWSPSSLCSLSGNILT